MVFRAGRKCHRQALRSPRPGVRRQDEMGCCSRPTRALSEAYSAIIARTARRAAPRLFGARKAVGECVRLLHHVKWTPSAGPPGPERSDPGRLRRELTPFCFYRSEVALENLPWSSCRRDAIAVEIIAFA